MKSSTGVLYSLSTAALISSVVLFVPAERLAAQTPPTGAHELPAVASPVDSAQNKRLQDLALLRQRLPSQMVAAKVGDAQRTKVLELLDAVVQISARRTLSGKEQETQARDFLARGGELRDLLEELNLPDPGDLLPPGPHSRLGISFGEDPRTGRAVVARVLPQYRADKMGMMVGDQILTLNGSPLLAKKLIETVVKAQRPYVIEVLRNGMRVALTEPKN